MKTGRFFILLTAAAWAAVCFFKVHQFADPTGGDGYFYLKQVEWLVHHFEFFHADFSFIFFPLALIYKLTGSSLLAFQIVTSISLFVTPAIVGLILFEKTDTIKNPLVRTLFACFFSLVFGAQGAILRLSYEFAKSGFAQAFLMLAIYFYLHKRIRLAIVFMVIAALTHKVAFLFVVWAFLFFGFRFFHKNRKKIYLLVVSALVLVFSIYGSRLFRHIDHFIQNFAFEKKFFLQNENQLLGRILAGLVFLWLVVGFIQFRKKKNPILLSALTFSMLAYLPIYSGYNIEIKYRLMLLSCAFAGLLFVFYWPSIQNQYLKRMLMLTSLTILSFQSLLNLDFPWIMNWSQRIQNLDRLQARVEPGKEVVAQHGLQFYIDFKTTIRARSMVSEGRKPAYQIAYVPEFYHLNPDLSDDIRKIQILSLGSYYGLFEYDEFQELMKEYPMLKDWRNLFQVRPGFVQNYEQL